MKKYILTSLCVTLAIAAEVTKKGPDIVVVDLAKVVNAEKPEESKSSEWSEVFSKLKSKIMGHRSKIEAKQQEFQQNFAQRDMNNLTEDERESLIKLENEVRTTTQLYQSAERELNDFQGKFFQKLTTASEEVRVEEGAKIVLQGPVLAADPSVDITDKVVKKMNAKHQTAQRAQKLTKLPETKPAKK